MLKPGDILKRLYEKIESSAQKRRITDLCVGSSYVGVKLDSDASGLAAVLPDSPEDSCNVLSVIGQHKCPKTVDILKYLIDGTGTLQRAIGLAIANALIEHNCDEKEDREATTYLNLHPGDKVAMIGFFSPLVERIRATGAVLTIIEINPRRFETLPPAEQQKALQDCQVAIITATTLLNNTFEETIRFLGKPRAVALIGPSTPLAPDIFRDTPVTHLGGVVVADSARMLQIVSDGGGTTALRPYLHFVNLILDH